jgi:homoserine dehydrogenase
MEDTGRDFADVLAEAQAKGYAEADPTFDIDGIDAAHKLSILASVAFGTAIDFQSVIATGIRRVLAADIAQADALGYYIRLIGMAETDVDADGNRRLFQRVHPHLVHRDHPLAHVDGATNAVVVEGNFAGPLLFQGAGAGDGPTASAVVADLIDIARGDIGAPFSIPWRNWTPPRRPPAAIAAAAPICASPWPTGPACSRKSPRRCAMPASPSKA